MGAFIGLYVAQLVVSAIFFVATAGKSGLSLKAENQRKTVIFAGLIPCVGLMLFVQLGGALGYWFAVTKGASNERKLGAQLQTSFDSPGRGNVPQDPPANDFSPGPASSPPPSDNPFL